MKLEHTIIVLATVVSLITLLYSHQEAERAVLRLANIPEVSGFAEGKKPLKSVNMIDVKQGTFRQITAYNAGDPYQTDDSPCIGASNEDICKMLEEGQKVCAGNFVPLGTVIYIDGYGECIVKDRMNRRYTSRVDIAMPLNQKQEARAFGLQKRLVTIIK